jgi:hypothetical protein
MRPKLTLGSDATDQDKKEAVLLELYLNRPEVWDHIMRSIIDYMEAEANAAKIKAGSSECQKASRTSSSKRA